jgi:DNA modification methylase
MTSALTHADRMLQTYDALLARKVGSAWARTQDYDSLLKSKTPLHEGRGKIIDPATVHPILFDYQRDIVLWAIRMWSNPGEVVFSPFGGIGSEPYVAVKTGRIGRSIELNPNYFRVAQRNLRDAEAMYARPSLFDELEKVNAS